MTDGGAKRHKPVPWLSLSELWKAGTSAGIASVFAERADKRGTLATQPLSRYDLTGSPGIHDGPFVLDYLADTGDGFDATYAMARLLNGDELPLPPSLGAEPADADKTLWRRRAHLLMLGGDQVYPGPGSGTSEAENNYEVRLKAVFDLADDMPPKPKDVPDDPEVDSARGYIAAIPGNHDYYDDGLESFLDCFAAGWSEDGVVQAPSDVTPSPNRDIVAGRYPFQARSYFAVRLPHHWWLWGIDTQLNGDIDRHQLDYFRDFIRPQVVPEDRIILCTARPSWVDAEGTTVDWYTARRRMGWFVNRIMGNDDPPYGKSEPDWMDHIPFVISGDKHHYARLSRPEDGRRDEKTAPEHLITCGGGGAYLSSTHHLRDEVSMPWHLETERDKKRRDEGRSGPGSTYVLKATFPGKGTSRVALRARFLRVLIKNGPFTPLFVAAIVVALAVLAVLCLSRHTWHWWVPTGLLAAALALLLERMLHSFKPKHQNPIGVFIRKLLLLLWHCGGYLVAAGLGTWAALSLSANDALGRSGWPEAADALLAENTPDLAAFASAGIAISALIGLLVFASYWLISDFLGWHENELFAGMQFSGYKSLLRIVIHPAMGQHAGATELRAGSVHLVVYGVDDVKKNRRKSGDSLQRSEAIVIDEVAYSPTD